MSPHSSTNFEIRRYYQNRFIQEIMKFIQEIIYIKKNKGWAYVINLDQYSDVGTDQADLIMEEMMKL